MKVLEMKELTCISGGGINGTMINAFLRGIGVLIDLGRSLGTSLRRIQTGKYC